MLAGNGRKWTCLDLANCIRIGDPIEEIADFLCRPVGEVQDKIVELERSGELQRRIAETTKSAKC